MWFEQYDNPGSFLSMYFFAVAPEIVWYAAALTALFLFTVFNRIDCKNDAPLMRVVFWSCSAVIVNTMWHVDWANEFGNYYYYRTRIPLPSYVWIFLLTAGYACIGLSNLVLIVAHFKKFGLPGECEVTEESAAVVTVGSLIFWPVVLPSALVWVNLATVYGLMKGMGKKP